MPNLTDIFLGGVGAKENYYYFTPPPRKKFKVCNLMRKKKGGGMVIAGPKKLSIAINAGPLGRT